MELTHSNNLTKRIPLVRGTQLTLRNYFKAEKMPWFNEICFSVMTGRRLRGRVSVRAGPISCLALRRQSVASLWGANQLPGSEALAVPQCRARFNHEQRLGAAFGFRLLARSS